MKVLAMAGSLREQSYNRGLVRAAQALAPSGMTLTIGDIAPLPLYNGDDDGDNRPAAVMALAEQVAQADALLFATPEYNYSIPGVLKNAIDWLSRVPGDIFTGKPAAIMGASMGGMTALAFALVHPGRVRRLVSISSASRSLPFSIALRSLQREMIRSDPAWQNGQYPLGGNGPVMGMRLARKLGMITYRSAAEWIERFGRERATDPGERDTPFGIDFEIESYLENHANRFIGSFDANCYLYLSRAMDLFDAADHGGSLAISFASLQLDSALVIGVKSDFLFPIAQQKELARALDAHVADVAFREMDSIQGHDSFLVDMDRFRPAMAAYF